jgi:hypothetical protein
VTAISKFYEYPDPEASWMIREKTKYFVKKYLDFDMQPFHVEILRKMFEGGRMVVNLPSDHGKSTLGTFVFPILSLIDNPNESHLICGANINDSKRRVAAIQRELENNTKLTGAFPWVKKPEGKAGRTWSTLQFNVTGRTINGPNPNVIATAVGAADIRGRRGKLIMDDIEGEESRTSYREREKLYDFVKLEAVRCYEDKRDSDRPLLLVLGTPFDIDSLYFKLEGEGWDTTRYKAFTFNPCSEDCEHHWQNRNDPKIGNGRHDHATLLWEAKRDKIYYMHDILTKEQFNIMMLMDPTGGNRTILSYKEMRRRALAAEFPEGEEGWHTLVSFDPASGSTNRRADYSAIMVSRIRWDEGHDLPYVEIQECYKVTEGMFEQVHMLAALANQYKCPVIYEANSQQGNTYANAFMHLHPEITLIRHFTSNQSKFDTKMGLTVLKTMMKQDSLKVMSLQVETEGFKQFLYELRDLGMQGAHDHLCAALWFTVRLAYEGNRWQKLQPITQGYVPSPQVMGYRRTPFYGGSRVIDAGRRPAWRR